MKKEIYNKITQKKEFSKLREIDVELAFGKFDKKEFSDLEKIKLTRALLRKVFSAFTSQKLLSLRKKDPEWFLKKHLSTRERFPYYEELYQRILKGYQTVSVIDLGSGINGFSYEYMIDAIHSSANSPDTLPVINYIAIDSIGQFMDLMNNYFKNNKLKGNVAHLSLFELNEIKNLIKKIKRQKSKILATSSRSQSKPIIVFLFKVIDSLEMIQKDYSKKLLLELFPLVDKIVISFATRSMVKGTKFKVQRNWILNFIKERFEILDDFELGNERYLIIEKRKSKIFKLPK